MEEKKAPEGAIPEIYEVVYLAGIENAPAIYYNCIALRSIREFSICNQSSELE